MSTYLNGQKVSFLTEYKEGGFRYPKGRYSYTLDGRRVGKGTGEIQGLSWKIDNKYYLYDGQNVNYEVDWTAEGSVPGTEIDAPQNISGYYDRDNNEVHISWDEVEDAFNYRVYRDGELIKVLYETSYIDDAVEGDVEYEYYVKAVDSDFHQSPSSNTLLITTTTYLSLNTIYNEDKNVLKLYWSDVDEAETYRIYKDGQLIEDGLIETSYYDSDVIVGESYEYYVQAIDPSNSQDFVVKESKTIVVIIRDSDDGGSLLSSSTPTETDTPLVRYTHPRSSGCCGGGGCGGSSNVFTDHPISMKINGQKYYYLYDGLGSVTEVINSNEEVVNRYRYTPYGESEVKEEQVYNPYQYTGRRYDEESGLYYYRARMYSPEQKRFTSSDPAGMMAGANRYAYAGNNPINKRDPSGMFPNIINMIDGAGGNVVSMNLDKSSSGSGLEISYSSTEINVNKCPNGHYRSFTTCVNYHSRMYPEDSSPAETCKDICYGREIEKFDPIKAIKKEAKYTFTTCKGLCGRIGCWALMNLLTSGIDTGYGFIANLAAREIAGYVPSQICSKYGCTGLCKIVNALQEESPAYAGSGKYPPATPRENDPAFG